MFENRISICYEQIIMRTVQDSTRPSLQTTAQRAQRHKVRVFRDFDDRRLDHKCVLRKGRLTKESAVDPLAIG